jgi:N-acylneuraminate cytidylyltransferase
MLRKGKALLGEPRTEAVMVVERYSHPIERALRKTEIGFLRYVNPEMAALRTQDMAADYHDLGLMYWLNAQNLLSMTDNNFSRLNIRPLVLPLHHGVDIDTEEDWVFAENMATFLLQSK